MIEFIKHTTGLCGEPHPSLSVFLIGALTTFFYFIKKKLKHK
jgi:hypothetical protein